MTVSTRPPRPSSFPGEGEDAATTGAYSRAKRTLPASRFLSDIMAANSRKRFIFTAIVLSLLGLLTGLFLGGNLLPSQLYDVRKTITETKTYIVDGEGEHVVRKIVTTTEMVPRGYSFPIPSLAPAAGGATAPADIATVPGPNEVWVLPMTFKPSQLAVPVGTKVTWLNKDGEPHSVTSATGLFDGALDAFKSYSYTFTRPGVYEYFCVPHPEMTGAITVK